MDVKWIELMYDVMSASRPERAAAGKDLKYQHANRFIIIVNRHRAKIF